MVLGEDWRNVHQSISRWNGV